MITDDGDDDDYLNSKQTMSGQFSISDQKDAQNGCALARVPNYINLDNNYQ